MGAAAVSGILPCRGRSVQCPAGPAGSASRTRTAGVRSVTPCALSLMRCAAGPRGSGVSAPSPCEPPPPVSPNILCRGRSVQPTTIESRLALRDTGFATSMSCIRIRDTGFTTLMSCIPGPGTRVRANTCSIISNRCGCNESRGPDRRRESDHPGPDHPRSPMAIRGVRRDHPGPAEGVAVLAALDHPDPAQNDERPGPPRWGSGPFRSSYGVLRSCHA